LKAPVDLLWNGGIGTYWKSTKANWTWVTARTTVHQREHRARVVGGGNLGCR
jgi:glutamate dehydrogenase